MCAVFDNLLHPEFELFVVNKEENGHLQIKQKLETCHGCSWHMVRQNVT